MTGKNQIVAKYHITDEASSIYSEPMTALHLPGVTAASARKLFANLSPPLPAPISPRPSPPSASEDEPRDKTARISPGSTSSLRCTRLPILSSPSSFFSAPPPSPPSVLVSLASYSLKSSSSMASIASQSITSSCASPSPSAAATAASVVDGSTAIDCDVSVIDVFVATFVDEDVVVVVVVVVVRFVVCMIVPSTSLFVVVVLL
uniref:Uncharacterized protein n=1 Tax=Glossina pallidipes TaxID=7398 RepID=A0A1B0AA66_GLOPL